LIHVYVDTTELNRQDKQDADREPIIIRWHDGTIERCHEVRLDRAVVRYFPEGVRLGDDTVRVAILFPDEDGVCVP
jgi:hypothetical protein